MPIKNVGCFAICVYTCFFSGVLKAEEPIPWYQKIRISGYAQLRYNRIPSFHNNDAFVNLQGDRSLAKERSFSIRRARISIASEFNNHIHTMVQLDMASVFESQSGLTVLRDLYADVFFDSQQTFKLRIGQSKIPFGFENMQSSGNRAAMDRADALNSGLKDERDMGAFFYWTPEPQKRLLAALNNARYKGAGDFGVLAIGIYNGQGMNQWETNKTPHGVVHGAWPFEIGEHIFEVGGGAYAGLYTIETETVEGIPVQLGGNTRNRWDARAYMSFYMAPKPFGIQAEYNLGTGPVLKQNASSLRITNTLLHGGYVQCLYTFSSQKRYVGDLSPFTRVGYYTGGRKHEPNTPEYHIKELVLGVEWVPFPGLRTTWQYDIGERNQPNYPYTVQKGHVARVQLQYSF
jgi:hypothetical protein